jgi:hypothetical protein
MNIDQAQAFSRQLIFFQEAHGFIVVCLHGRRKRLQQGKNLIAVPDESASQLSDYESVTNDFALQEQRRQFSVPVPQVLDPYRCVD